MDEPKSLDSLFKEKIFRIPDYQRGYAWQQEQLKDFWEDLINLSYQRSHYTGVLTLKQLPSNELAETAREYWLVEDHAYQLYHVIDGQQRLTTFVIFLQAFVDVIRALPENTEQRDDEIYISESLSIAAVQERYLFKIKPTGDQFRTYKFGYAEDNPSYDYLRYRILNEAGAGLVQETFYTLNLGNAKHYFTAQLEAVFAQGGLESLQEIYKKLTKRFLFNEYVIKDEFDVFVAFETMNNRGKRLSDLELLKNRLIYLTTLYAEDEADPATRANLRATINDAWKEVYRQLGRNKLKPLNDDDFLRAHWILYYTYTRKSGADYIRFLLDKQFTPQRIHQKVEREVVLVQPEEVNSATTDEEAEELTEADVGEEGLSTALTADLSPIEISNYVRSLKACAAYWFDTFFPHLSESMDPNEQRWLEALNRIGMGYFRPLLMSIRKNEPDLDRRVHIYQRIERFIFIAFRLNSTRSNYRSTEFYNAARTLDRGEVDVDAISARLDACVAYAFDDEGQFRIDDFRNILFKKFQAKDGYFGWAGLRYFLYEYELHLLSESRQKKLDWTDLLKKERDKISIEHVYPQTPAEGWEEAFAGIPEERRQYYNASVGNLLLLSMSINSSLQNDAFDEKKQARFSDQGKKIRNGYADGSHSEIEVAQCGSWGPEQIRERGIRLLQFMGARWDLKFRSEADLEELLFLNFEEG